MSISHL